MTHFLKGRKMGARSLFPRPILLLSALALCSMGEASCAKRSFGGNVAASSTSVSLDQVRRISSTKGKRTALFSWFSQEGRGQELLLDPAVSLTASLGRKWERIQNETTAAYSSQGGAGVYFAEDPFTSYEFGDALLISFSAPTDVSFIDYFGPGVDDPEAVVPPVLDAAIREPYAAFRYKFGGWFGGKALVVRRPEILDLGPQGTMTMKRPPARSLLTLDSRELQSLVGKPWLEVLPKVIDQAALLREIHLWLFPETDNRTEMPKVALITPEGKMTDEGGVWFLKEVLRSPSPELKAKFKANLDRLGRCGEWAFPQCESAFGRFLDSGLVSPGGIPVGDFAAMLHVLEFISPDSKPVSVGEFRSAIAAGYGNAVRSRVEALAAIVRDMHAQLAPGNLSTW